MAEQSPKQASSLGTVEWMNGWTRRDKISSSICSSSSSSSSSFNVNWEIRFAPLKACRKKEQELSRFVRQWGLLRKESLSWLSWDAKVELPWERNVSAIEWPFYPKRWQQSQANSLFNQWIMWVCHDSWGVLLIKPAEFGAWDQPRIASSTSNLSATHLGRWRN